MKNIDISVNDKISKFICRVIFLLLTAAAAIMVIGFLAFGWFQHPPSVEHIGNATIYSNYAGVGAPQVRIVIALLFAVLSVWIPRPIPITVRLIPFIWIVVEYVLWGIGSYQIYAFSEDISSYKGVLYLHNATLWDIAVLLVVLVSVICLILTEFRKHRLSWKQKI